MATRQFHKTKKGFKLPEGVCGKKVVGAYSTSKNILIEGYEGLIRHIKSRTPKPATFLACRRTDNHGAKAWVTVTT